MKTLNIAAGKFNRLEWEDKLVFPKPELEVLLDNNYYKNESNSPEYVEQFIKSWNVERFNLAKKQTIELNEDAFTFMEKTSNIFDHVCIYRFLEHVSFTQVLYFIYLVSTVTRVGSYVDIIVPNYEILSKIILNENFDNNFEKNNILITTELLNEPSCPHASIWTPKRAIYFWELEGRFRVYHDNISTPYKFDGRNIYLRFLAKRL